MARDASTIHNRNQIRFIMNTVICRYGDPGRDDNETISEFRKRYVKSDHVMHDILEAVNKYMVLL
jgi:hypothetical protein